MSEAHLTRVALAPTRILLKAVVKAATIGSGPVIAFCLVAGLAYLTSLTESFGLSPTMFARSSLETGFYGFECGALGLIQFVRGNFYFYLMMLIAVGVLGLVTGTGLAVAVARGSRAARLLADRLARWHDPVQGVVLAVVVLLLVLTAILSGPTAGYAWGARQAGALRASAVAGRCPTYHTAGERYRGCLIIADAQRVALATRDGVMLIQTGSLVRVSPRKGR